jgi:signal transduction histidine kinase
MSVAPARQETFARGMAARLALLACLLVITAVTSHSEHWQPPALVVVLTAAMVVADLAAVEVRHVRISAGLTVQVTIMALLGPAPAVLAAVVANVVDARVHRVSATGLVSNLILYVLLGLGGGLLFAALRNLTGLDRDDALYAALVMPCYLLFAIGSLLIVAANPIGQPHRSTREVLHYAGVPVLALELVNGVLATMAVLAWTEGGITAVAFVVVALAIGLPLAWTVGHTLRRDDEVVAIRQVSDERAAEVARLASDRERLLSEVLRAEERERTRLAENLHDGPMQRLMAIRQDAAEGATGLASDLDEAIAETRALISAFHPATVRELGFAASLRAAVAPFPAARTVTLTVHSEVGDGVVEDSLLQPVAQELVVNAVKHASPAAIDVVVKAEAGALVLEVNDDGVGIDTEQAGRAVQAGHVGLAMVRRRVEDAGGRIEIATRPDGGTRSHVVLPMPA